MRRHPIREIRFEASMGHSYGPITGSYVKAIGAVRLNAGRPAVSFGREFVAGVSHSVSSAGLTREAAMQRTLVHELGHHVLNVGGDSVEAIVREAWSKGRPLTGYAELGDDHRDYFAECFAAYAYHRQELSKFDGVGYDMVVKVREMMGIGR